MWLKQTSKQRVYYFISKERLFSALLCVITILHQLTAEFDLAVSGTLQVHKEWM